MFILHFQKSNQISASNISFKLDKIKILNDLKKDAPLNFKNVKFYERSNASMVSSFLHKVKAQLNYNNIDLGNDFDLEISHHYGLKKFKSMDVFCLIVLIENMLKK